MCRSVTACPTFQSTRPHEARLTRRRRRPVRLAVSIHAPARGATRSPRQSPARRGGFNPRARTRRDTLAAMSTITSRKFQSTRPHEARRTCVATTSTSSCFNPRARTRRDTGLRNSTCPKRCFNPRARTRRDDCVLASGQGVVMFQSTRPHEARPVPGHKPGTHRSFNPRARTRRDSHPARRQIQLTRFQSTRPHEARLRSSASSITLA